MAFNDMVIEFQKVFPKLKIAYKDSSLLMQLIGKLMFFDQSFMTEYTTTIGNTIFFPSAEFISSNPISAEILLCHECTHISDSTNINDYVYSLSYILPQGLSLLIPFLLFILSWKIVLPLFILSLCPIPSYFRKVFEMRAYMVSIYANNALCKKFNLVPDFAAQEANIVSQFKGSAYYFMWPMSSVNRSFDAAVALVKAGKRPFNDPFFYTIDKIIAVA